MLTHFPPINVPKQELSEMHGAWYGFYSPSHQSVQYKLPITKWERERKMPEYCVTGGTGFIAAYLVKSLLEKGHTVRTTVRDPGTLTSPAKDSYRSCRSYDLRQVPYSDQYHLHLATCILQIISNCYSITITRNISWLLSHSSNLLMGHFLKTHEIY